MVRVIGVTVNLCDAINMTFGVNMNSLSSETIVAAEETLKSAMLISDTQTLSELLSDDLVFVNHFGQVVTKAQDLALHQSGQLRLEAIELSEMTVQLIASVGVVQVRATIHGTYDGMDASGEFMFSRVWAPQDGRLKVHAVHSTQVASSIM
ncbi:nuclear transport factor 2 family protein [Photobacterium sp. TY1-4]|uniref:nuclear transport factor 2 family protein n=1 Tax=Photobacterium sp. TY1-4 TaxID=2899122 RepID=UPI0021C0D654|nr:nuclear transport factor 2 family protein [Photobacterium sp. TY1-4]UXH99977.1 nuclear transport factor 2 family protein [Photobacterium sp. TY1-4]